MKTRNYIIALWITAISGIYARPVPGIYPDLSQTRILPTGNDTEFCPEDSAKKNYTGNAWNSGSDVIEEYKVSLTARTHHLYCISVLQWKPVFKKDIRYEVCRSIDDCKSWQKIGEIKVGKDDSVSYCEFTDRFPKQRNFYILRLATDSAVMYSNRSAADFTLAHPSWLTSFNPGPSPGFFSFAVKAKCEYSITNSYKEVIMEGEIEGQKYVSSLPKGTYFLNFYTPDNIETFMLSFD